MEFETERNNLNVNIAQIMSSLPSVVRDFIKFEKYTTVVKGAMTKYELHVDQGDMLEKQIIFLLMGIADPDEFIDVLKNEARLDEKTVASIVDDVNKQIFIPLRRAEESEGLGDAENTVAEPAPSAPAELVAPEAPRNVSPESIAPQYAPQVPTSEAFVPAPSPFPAPPISVLPPKEFVPVPPPPPVQTEKLSYAPLPPKMTMPDRAMPRPEVVPENLPGAMPAPFEPTQRFDTNDTVPVPPAPIPSPPTPPRATEPSTPYQPAENPLTKSYAVDPYRESVADDEQQG